MNQRSEVGDQKLEVVSRPNFGFFDPDRGRGQYLDSRLAGCWNLRGD